MASQHVAFTLQILLTILVMFVCSAASDDKTQVFAQELKTKPERYSGPFQPIVRERRKRDTSNVTENITAPTNYETTMGSVSDIGIIAEFPTTQVSGDASTLNNSSTTDKRLLTTLVTSTDGQNTPASPTLTNTVMSVNSQSQSTTLERHTQRIIPVQFPDFANTASTKSHKGNHHQNNNIKKKNETLLKNRSQPEDILSSPTFYPQHTTHLNHKQVEFGYEDEVTLPVDLPSIHKSLSSSEEFRHSDSSENSQEFRHSDSSENSQEFHHSDSSENIQEYLLFSTEPSDVTSLDKNNLPHMPKPAVMEVFCYQIQCGEEQGVNVNFHSEPTVEPWGTNVTFECHVAVSANTNFTIWWVRQHSSSYGVDGQNRQTETLKEEIVPAAGSGNETIMITSVLTLANVSARDSGYYTCSAQLTSQCCFINATRQLVAYHPPQHNSDLIIIVCVCILQALMILFVYTKSRQTSRSEPKTKDIPLQTVKYTPIEKLSLMEEGDGEDLHNDNNYHNEDNGNESKV